MCSVIKEQSLSSNFSLRIHNLSLTKSLKLQLFYNLSDRGYTFLYAIGLEEAPMSSLFPNTISKPFLFYFLIKVGITAILSLQISGTFSSFGYSTSYLFGLFLHHLYEYKILWLVSDPTLFHFIFFSV